MRYWKLQNNDGKCWLIPTRHVATALAIYQPGAWRGRMLKRWLPLLSCFGRIVPFQKVENPIDEALRQRLEALFPGRRLEYSLFLGTPSVHQKTVIQVYEGNSILAYAKVTEAPSIKALFDHEQDMLRNLHNQGIKHIPECLHNAPLDEQRQLFVMSTEKTATSQTPHYWTHWHRAFLDDLQAKTTCEVLFEDSDYAHLLRALCDRLSTRPTYKYLLDETYSLLNTYQGQTLSMAVMHADFTPWNMFLQRNHLFVFDWEYALRTAPIALDEQHFFVQTAIHEQHLTAEQIVRHYYAQHTIAADVDRLKMYLLLQIAIYVCREPSPIIPTTIDVYTDILNVLNNEH